MGSATASLAALIAGAAAALALGACSAKPSATAQHADAAGSEAAYLAPPSVDSVRVAAGSVVLAGAAPPGSRVRIATPAGQASFATVDAGGRWTMALLPAADARLFGLSAAAGTRVTQAQGYLLVTPGGQAALLRAGAGALRIDRPRQPGLRAIDFDRGGGLMVSASVAPGATVILRVDGHDAAEGRANADGDYEASLGYPVPIRPGAHPVQVSGDGFADQVVVRNTPAQPLAAGPLRSQLTSAGLRIDWMTPGGGVQSTLLVH